MAHDDPIARLKQQLGAELSELVAGWRGSDIGVLLELDRGRIAELRRGDLRRFSLERLIRLLARGGYRVELHVLKRTAE